MKNIAIIPAAGDGKRFDGATSKLFALLGDRPILAWTLQAFERSSEVDEVMIAIRPEDQEQVSQLVSKSGFRKVTQMISGGRTRQESVSHAIFHLKDAPEIVVIHDAARPLVRSEMIDRAVAGAREYGAVAFGISPSDTVKKVNSENVVAETLPRNILRLIQTPEAFQLSVILQAYLHDKGSEQGAFDDAELVEQMGGKVIILPGDPRNIKITTVDDLRLAESFLEGKVA